MRHKILFHALIVICVLANIIVLFIFVGCGNLPVVPAQPCMIYQDHGATWDNSLIAARIPDPCKAVRLLTTGAKLPAVEWRRDYTDAFDDWAANLETVVSGNISYLDLQSYILMEVGKLNAKVGMTLLIISEGIFVFDDTGLLMPKDVELLLALIQHLRHEVGVMGLLA